jgi:predicted DNA-binding transcriptional regulator AlpA
MRLFNSIRNSSVQYLNFKELRKKLGGRSRSAIYNDLDANRLPPPIKLGGRLYWVDSYVDDFLAGNRSPGGK